MKNRNAFWKGALLGALVMLCAVSVFGGVGRLTPRLAGFTKGGGQVEEKLDLLWQMLSQNYLREDELDEAAMVERAYAGYVDALGDPYTSYYDEEQTQAMLESFSGEYSGIGAGLNQNLETRVITITKVYEGQPADEAGMKVGDVLYKVDDKEITDEDLSEVVTWVKGKEGTTVDLYVLREGEELKLTATRRKVEVQTVESGMKDGGIGYILVTEFDNVTYEQFKKSLETLEAQGMKGLVIDLRSNPGGGLDTVVDMLRLILPEGRVVSMEDKNGKETVYECDGRHEFTKPLVVLVNENSASASEIFAGAVKDYGIGKIVGMTTYGKGVVQKVFYLQDGSSIKITISEYFTPKKNSINGIGVVPDVEVEYVKDGENPEADNQLDAALEEIRKEL